MTTIDDDTKRKRDKLTRGVREFVLPLQPVNMFASIINVKREEMRKYKYHSQPYIDE